jgi:hypothetical protein
MSLCSLCGQPTLEGDGLCVFHFYRDDGDWSRGNRIMCNFLHRGVVAPASGERTEGLDVLAGVPDEAVVP